MKSFWLTSGCSLLLLYFIDVFGQQGALPDHFPKYLKTGPYAGAFQQGSRQSSYGTKTSGTKTFSKTYTKTGSSYGNDYKDNRQSGSYFDTKSGAYTSQQTGCTTNPRPPMNSHIRCGSAGNCNATCLSGYKFPDGKTRLTFVCKSGSWVLQKPEWLGVSVGNSFDVIPVACEPICEPGCENNGICYEPNRCNCPDNFSGMRCENSRKPCLNYPALPMNARRTCSTTQCTVTCMRGHAFPDGSAITNLKCIEGNWIPNRDDWKFVPDCQPSCNPPCQNGGNCLSLNMCQCPQQFRGLQCEYRADACSAKRLGFNGAYNCTGNSNTFKCSLSCPVGIEFDITPALHYTCSFSTGMFEPQPIPQCVFSENIQVISIDSGNDSHYKEMLGYHENLTRWQASNVYTSAGNRNGTKYGQLVTIQEDLPQTGTCYSWGGSHVKTFDGATFSATSSCAHTLVRDASHNTFSIVVSNDNGHRVLYIYLQDKEYTLTQTEPDVPALFGPGGKRLPLPGQVPGLRSSMEGHHVVLVLDSLGVEIKWDTNNFIQVQVSESLWNRTEGLCGRLDGDKSNDLLGKDGQKKRTIAALFDSWKLNILGESCSDPPSDSFFCAAVSKTLSSRAHQFCSQLLTDKRFHSCAGGQVEAAAFLEACQWDYCACGAQQSEPSACACQTVAVFVEECRKKVLSSDVLRWRDETTCPMNCNGGRIYTPCASSNIQPTCGAFSDEFSPTFEGPGPGEHCQEGCYCPKGSVLHAGHCIQPEMCSCNLRGREFPPGAQVPKECNTCTCEGGHWKCTSLECGARCSAVGDPHYQTFDGKRFDFMGQCQYYLVKSSNFSIEADNVACAGAISQSMNYPVNVAAGLPSCTRSVSIHTSSGHTIKLKQNQEVFVDGQDVLRLPYLVGEGEDIIRMASSIFIVVELENGMEVWWDGVTRVYIDAPANLRDKVAGLCGTFNSNQKDDFLTPEGDIETDPVAFANKWKVDERCENVKQNLHSKEHPCEVNIHNKEKAEKYCQIIHSKLFSACHWLVDPQQYYEDCLYDMCSCEMKVSDCLCSVVSAYGTACAALGSSVAWRSEVPECGISCPRGQFYQPCTDSCSRSCLDISTRPNCKSVCVEGCNCPEGQSLNEENDCVPIGECPCQHDGVNFPSGYKEIRQASLAEELCVCSNAVWLCRPANKDEIKSNPSASDRQTVCSINKNQEFTTCEPPVPISCRNMHEVDLFAVTSAVCKPGCKCKPGYVLKEPIMGSGLCVRPTECPCHHGGKSYKENETVKSDCNTCKCREGIWECTKNICAAICSSWGDSHFTSFDGRDFDYQGQCDFILSKGSLGKHDMFEITVQNIPCGSLGVSCTKSLSITVSGETITLTRDKPIPNYKLLRRLSLRQLDLYVIVEASDLGLTVIWDKGTRLSIKVDPRWHGRLKGLCGNYNDDQTDDFQTPSGGFSEISALVFGDSWRVNPACPGGSEVRDSCAQRPERRSFAVRKCGILKEPVFQTCHNQVPVERFLERCIFDTCACDKGGDCDCLCSALSAYAQECNNKGVHIKWRTQKLCPLQCDEKCAEYSPCISTCPVETCDNLLSHSRLGHLCASESCVEGCAPKPCAPGQIYLNTSSFECVPKSTCKPVCMELDGIVYSEGDLISDDDCQKCFCSRNKKICTGKPCDVKLSTIPPQLDSKIKCISGWSVWLNQDVAKNKNEFKTGKKIDLEPLPSAILLNSQNLGGKCQPEKITNIQCRTVSGQIDPKATGLDVECSLEHGLVCKSDKTHKCPDFEIRILCQCEETPPPPPQNITHCDISVPHTKHATDCHLFYHCAPTTDGYVLVEKTCGPAMWFNPQTQICDWPDNVAQIRSDCSDLEKDLTRKRPKPQNKIELLEGYPANKTLCPVGFKYSDCGTECHRLCLFYNHVVRSGGHCLTGSACEEGCIKEERALACPPGFLWRDNSTCVHVDDCVCRAHDGSPVRPGTIHHESDCELCQCISNHYTCDRSACTTTPASTTEPPLLPPGATVIEPGPQGLKPTETPPQECPLNNYANLLGPGAEYPVSDDAFTASGVLNEAHQPWHARLGAKLPVSSAGAWAPDTNNQDQYLQVDLGRVEPVYGVILLGNPLYDNYVTSFQLLYSSDPHGSNYRYAMTKSGLPQLFRGSVDQHTPVKAFLDVPVEARYIRLNPKTWHNEISVRLDVIGCSEVQITTAKTETTVEIDIDSDNIPPPKAPEDQMMCDEPMGVSNGLLTSNQITVSSEKIPNLKSKGVAVNFSQAWQPLANTPNEFIKFDFGAPRQLTGVQTHGGPHGWVSAYKVAYSHDNFHWNPIVDDFGGEKVFPGNFDQSSVYTNMFDKPVRAQYLKILPKKWTSNIEMCAEPLGCFEPYPTQPPTNLVEIDEPTRCQHCPEVAIPVSETVSGVCLCDGTKYWDGMKCIPRAECPCKIGALTYPVGTVFEKEDCSECLCSLGGVAQCSPKKCPPCDEGLKAEVGHNCGCVCKPCPPGQVLCLTSNICINITSWCDGVVDCPDDEVNCVSATTIEPLITTQKAIKLQCPPVVCPPGFKITLRKSSREEDLQKNLSPMFHMYGGRKTKMTSNKMTSKYYGAKGRQITGRKNLPRKPLKENHTTLKNVKQQICVEFVCEPPVETLERCPEPACPPGYTVVYGDDGTQNLETLDEKLCKSYECHPPPVRDDICNITGRSFNTFDGTEYTYDICNHIIARDLHSEDWDISLVKNCSDICSRDVVIRHGDQLVKIFSDLSIEFNGYRYTAEQTSKIGARNLAFVVSRMGDTLLFVSNHFGFWLMYNSQSNLKIGVTEKLIGQVDGLCGFYDKNPKNDKRKPDGRQAKTSAQFGEAWLLEDSGRRLCEVRTCPLHVQNAAFKMCQAVKERILAPCHHAIEDVDGWISRCLETTCSCLEQAKGGNKTSEGEEKCRCNVLETFVVECTTARSSIDLEDWRMQLECPASCEVPLVHHDCYRRRCEPSCSNLAETDACPTLPNLCFPGCYCPAGLVRKKDKCVAPRECRDCECNVLPHLEYTTFDGANHTANTNCTYVMAREKNVTGKSSDFQVYVSNGPCPLNPAKMCTSTLTLLVNGHRIEVKRGLTPSEDDHQVSIDDYLIEKVPFDNGWLEITKLPARHINILIPKLQLELRAYYPTLGASLRVPSHSYGSKMEGICGDCNRNPENDNLNPLNHPVFSEKDFVQSWQADDPRGNNNSEDICVEEAVKECKEVTGPDGKDPCLALLDADRFGQCHMLLDPQIFLSTCYHETCGGKPEASCSSLSTYALGCRAQGLCIDYHTELCPSRTCPPGSDYELCGPPCAKTCDNPTGCTKGLPKEGCFCPDGLVLKNGTLCVEEKECYPCDDFGHFPGDSWTQDACTKCHCDVITRTTRCETKSCPAVETVCDEGLEAVKIKKSESDCCDKFACVPANITKPECEEPKPLNCGEDQIRKLEKRPDGCLDFVCQCISPSECPDLTQPTSEPLPAGIERIISDTGCCPREKLICKIEKCPRTPSCPKHHQAERLPLEEGHCCPEFKCVTPSNKCLFTKSYTAADAGGERSLTTLEQDVVLLDENSTISDGPCRLCKCERQSTATALTTSCTVTECPSLSESSAAKEYVLEAIWTRGLCCPLAKKTACKFNEGIRSPGEKWPLDLIKSPCVVLECLPGSPDNEDVSITRHVVTCDNNCAAGSDYKSPSDNSGDCCGQCQQTACTFNGQIKPVGQQWTSDDYCTEYKCVNENGTIFVSKKEITCPKPGNESLSEFVYTYHKIDKQCCGRYESRACLVDGNERHVGDTWPDPGGDPCVTVMCLHSGEELTQQRTVESCSQECRPGWKYRPSGAADICCGECTQVACVSNGTLYLPGDTWQSENACTTYECTKQHDGGFTVSVNQESCPDLTDCPLDSIWQDGCCRRCNLTSAAMTSVCEPSKLVPEDTIGLVVQTRSEHGRCRNIDPLDGFTECRGHCTSGTFFNQKSSMHESTCTCCQAVQFTGIGVELICPDGFKFKKQVAVPSECRCNSCGVNLTKRPTKT